MLHLASRRRSLPALVGLLLLTPGASVRAQSSLEITPFVASFYALSNVTEQSDVPLPDFQGRPPGSIIEEQQASPAIGVRASVPITGTIRAEAEAVYAFSDGRLSELPRTDPDAGLGVSGSAYVYMASARAVLRPRRQNFFGLAGVGIVGRGGDFWQNKEQGVRLAGVVGVGVRAAVSPRLSLIFNAEAYLYGTSTSDQVLNAQSKFQQDILVSVGVPIGTR